MGINYDVLMDHRFTPDNVGRLPEELQAVWVRPAVLTRYLEGVSHLGEKWEWDFSIWRSGREQPVSPPRGLLGRIFGRSGKDSTHALSTPDDPPPADLIFGDEGYLALEGPDLFSGWVGRRGMEVSTGLRWIRFLEDAELRAGVQEIVGRIASAVGASVILHVPDCTAATDLLDEGADIGAVIEYVRAELGEPVSRASDLLNAGGEVASEGWIMERRDRDSGPSSRP